MPELIIRVVGDTSAFERSMRRSRTEAQRFGASFRGVNHDVERGLRGVLSASGAFNQLNRSLAFASTSFLGGAGAVFALKAASSAASNMNEQLSKSRVVFGAASRDVERFANGALGLAKDQALEFASSFGALLRPLGLTGDQAEKVSVQLTRLGVDLSSFFNTDTADALDAIRSGLVGEVEPLRRYGVLLSQARVRQEALTETGKAHAKSLTNQELVQARVALILKDSAKAQGDYQRTLGGLANQQREFQKNIRNLEISIGGALNPTILEVTKSLNEWLDKSGNQERVTRDVGKAVDVAKDAIKGIVSVVTPAAKAFERLGDAVGGTENELKILAGLALAAKLSKIGTGIGLIGTNAEKAKAETSLLAGNLERLRAIGAIAIPITILMNGKSIQDFFKQHGLGFLNPSIASDLKRGADAVFGHTSDPLAGLAPRTARNPFPRGTQADDIFQAVSKTGRLPLNLSGIAPHGLDQAALILGREVFKAAQAGAERGATTGGRPRGTLGEGAPSSVPLNAAQRFKIALAGSPEDLTLLRQQAQKDRNAIAFAEKLRASGRISNAKYVATVTNYQDDLNATLDHITSIQQAAAAAVAAARAKAAAARQKIAQDRSAFTDARSNFFAPLQDTVKSLGALGRGPGLASFEAPAGLRLALAKAGLTSSSSDDESVLRRIRRAARGALRNGNLAIDGQISALEAIADINKQLAGATKGDVTKFRHVSSKKLAEALGFQGDALRRARVPFAISVPEPSSAFSRAGGGVTFNAPVTQQFYGVTDTKQVQEEMRKLERGRPRVRRGAR